LTGVFVRCNCWNFANFKFKSASNGPLCGPKWPTFLSSRTRQYRHPEKRNRGWNPEKSRSRWRNWEITYKSLTATRGGAMVAPPEKGNPWPPFLLGGKTSNMAYQPLELYAYHI